MSSYNDKDVLLEEYKTCSSRADHLTTLIWSLGTALLGLSAAALLFAGQIYIQAITIKNPTQILPSIQPILVTLLFSEIMAAASIYIVCWWNKVANRWNAYITVLYNRMKEIESFPELNMWANRDIEIFDHMYPIRPHDVKQFSQEEKNRFIQLMKSDIYSNYSNYSNKSIRQLRNKLKNIVAISWIALLVAEILITWYYLNHQLDLFNFSGLDNSTLLLIVLALIGLIIDIGIWLSLDEKIYSFIKNNFL